MKLGNEEHLAWHETLELHELVASQANQLVGFKKMAPAISDKALQALYMEAIRGMEQNLRELLRFYPKAPSVDHRAGQPDMAGIQAGQLLGFAKSAVKSYAAAITEAATPEVRETFHNHLNRAIQLHGKVFAYMYEKGFYPAYSLNQLLANDVKNAQFALSQ